VTDPAAVTAGRVAVPDPGVVASLIEAVAADIIRPRFRALADHEIREKGPGDVVTVADLESEARLSQELTALLPGSVVVGEEGTATDSTVLDRLSGPDPVWVIDPVDGTANFAAGRPTVAVIVALCYRGETVAGWIADALGGPTAIAVRGQGAWIDDRRLAVAAAAPVSTMTGFLNTRFLPKARRAVMEARIPELGPTDSRLCAGHEYRDLSAGARHWAFYRRTKAWDHAAGVLMHTEAGGHAARHDGTPYQIADPDGGLLLAPDRDSWAALARILID